MPIARTGWYEYLKREIGLEGNEIVKVNRSEEEVFSKAAMASFEGKIVTAEHPPNPLTPNNASIYTKGVVQNVRQSKDERDLLLADLVVYEQSLIEEIQNGKREVSCGYDYTCVENGDGTYSQKNICGNHVAVVEAGRAGRRVSIKDTNKEIGGMKMSKLKIPRKGTTVSNFLRAVGLKQFAIDAEPEELSDVVDEIAEESRDEDMVEACKDNEAEAKDESPNLNIEELAEFIKSTISDAVKSLQVKDEAAPEEAIDELLGELKSNDSEESETIEAEDEDITDGEVSEPDSRPENPIVGADKAIARELLKSIKPVIAQIKDPVARKRACDSITNAYKNATKKGNKVNSYEQILNAQRYAANDSTIKNKTNGNYYSNLGEEIAKKYNANYKGGK